MKTVLLLTLTLSLAAAAAVPFPQKGDDQAFAAFFTKFKAAVATIDKEAVAAMTKLPFLFENQERSKEEFVKIYDRLFDRKVRGCFLRAQPVKDGDSYSVACAKYVFHFERVKGEYKFSTFTPDPEQ
jgi:hypothetical protein